MYSTFQQTATASDDDNPAFFFQTAPTELLLKLANGEIDAATFAKQELAGRGRNWQTGQWVGFAHAEQQAA